MQFLLIAKDGTDEGALERRLTAREEHLAGAHAMQERGEKIIGGAILDDAGKMVGSMMVLDFPSRTELDTWLKSEIYVTTGVWKDIEIMPYKVAVH